MLMPGNKNNERLLTEAKILEGEQKSEDDSKFIDYNNDGILDLIISTLNHNLLKN